MQRTLPVALVYGDADACTHLRTALTEFNADIVYDSTGDAVDREALGKSGAKVAVVNLDDTLDPKLDDIYAILEACGCRVVFNDPGSSVVLEGWEHARWVRHLAAKLRDDVDVDPPRPPDAEPVDVAEASHLGDQWLDEALGVLATESDAPGLAATEATLPSAAAAVVLPDVVTETEISPHAEDEAPAQPIAAMDDALDATVAELESEPELDFTPDTEEFDVLPDQAATATASDVPDDPAWDELEHQLAASFADNPSAPPASASAEFDDTSVTLVPPTPAQTADDADFAMDGLAIDWSLLDDEHAPPPTPESASAPVAPMLDDVAQGLDDMLAPGQLPFENTHNAAAQEDAETTMAFASDSLADGVDAAVPPSSEWTLFDDTVAPPSNGRPFADTDTEETSATRVPGETSAKALADREFGIELVDPIEYLAPEAPPRETELYNAVELISMAEALAPQPIDENIHAEAVAEPLPRVVVLCASIGGPDAVREFLAGLPAGFPALFVLAQHMGSEFIDLMVNQLGKAGALPVRVPATGERAVAGELLVVPNGAQLELSRKGAISMSSSPGSNESDPSVGQTMSMAAKVFAADTLAIIFSGMVDDVVAGATEVVEHGGSVWAQDPSACVVSTMVDNVNAAGLVKFCATPALLAQHLIETFAKESAP